MIKKHTIKYKKYYKKTKAYKAIKTGGFRHINPIISENPENIIIPLKNNCIIDMPITDDTYQDINTCITPLYIFERLVRENMNFALIDLDNCIIQLKLINQDLPISSENLLHVFTIQDDYTLRYTNINSPISIEQEQHGKRKYIIIDDYKICAYSDFLNETIVVEYTDFNIRYTQIVNMLIYEKYILIELLFAKTLINTTTYTL